MAIKKKCVICDTEFLAHRYNQKYCSDECFYKGQQEIWRRADAKKKERRKNAEKGNKLDAVLEEAKARDMTYAEYQVAKTLQKIAKGEL